MSDFLKQYILELRTQTPVFIGQGKEIGKKEYIYDFKRNEVLVLDFFKAFQGLKKRKLDGEFQKYLMNPSDPHDLYSFFRVQRVDRKDYLPWIAYTMPMGDTLNDNNSKRNISTFIKDPYGLPYVPGSSLKGVLRTALLQYDLLSRPDLAADDAKGLSAAVQQDRNRETHEEVKKIGRKVEAAFLHNRISQDEKKELEDAVNDMMRYVIVGDSTPLNLSDLCLCRKIDLSQNGNDRAIPVLRECLKPGTVITFPVTIDTRASQYKRNTITQEKVAEAIRKSYANYKDKFLSAFPNVPFVSGEDILYLGGGCGYPLKTFPYAMANKKEAVQITAQIMRRQFPQKGRNGDGIHDHDEQRGISPKVAKCTDYNNKLMQMGACSVTKFELCNGDAT